MAALLEGLTLTRKDGSKTEASALKDKIVAFYFSAHWCPPCRMFTPELAKFYSEVNKEGLEIVFVSFDHDAEKAMKYIAEAHGNWLYLLPEDQKVKDLSDRFSVDGIPTLIVVKPDGSIITNDGRSDVSTKPPKAVISSWKSQL